MFSGIIASLMCARERESESFLTKRTVPDDTTRTHAVDVRDGGRTIEIPGGWGRRLSLCTHITLMCYGWTRPRRWADTRQRETANAEDDAGGDGGSGEAYEAGLFPSSKTPWACTTMGLTTVSGAKAATEDVEGRVQCIANTGPTGPRRMGGGQESAEGREQGLV